MKTGGLNNLVFAPCANVPGQGDFLRIMQENLKNTRLAFSKYILQRTTLPKGPKKACATVKRGAVVFQHSPSEVKKNEIESFFPQCYMKAIFIKHV
jgi:hypothetical protein